MDQLMIDILSDYIKEARTALHNSCDRIVELQCRMATLEAKFPQDDPKKMYPNKAPYQDPDYLYRFDRLAGQSKALVQAIHSEYHAIRKTFDNLYDDALAVQIFQIYTDIRGRLRLLFKGEIADIAVISPVAACAEFETLAKSTLDKAKELIKFPAKEKL